MFRVTKQMTATGKPDISLVQDLRVTGVLANMLPRTSIDIMQEAYLSSLPFSSLSRHVAVDWAEAVARFSSDMITLNAGQDIPFFNLQMMMESPILQQGKR